MNDVKIGWIGTGVMGEAMCSRLIDAGYKCCVSNRTKSKTDSLVAKGATFYKTPFRVAKECDIVFTMVGFPKDVEQVYFADTGLLEGSKPGQIFCDMTTTKPSIATRIYSTSKTYEVEFVDAPVSGGDVGAKNGKLSIMAGGDKAIYDKLKPLFDILGTVPGYREGDISEWFLMFFTLFFAMIIGDAGYGLIFLIAGFIMQKKTKELTTANILIYVLSIATMIWGSITGTWFGSATIIASTPLKYLVIPAIANYPALFNMDSGAAQNNIMQFCFILGTIQLSLAEVINITRKARAKDISLIADIGWLMDILSLYFVVLNLVIQKPCNYGIVFPIIGVGFVLVVVFGSQKPGVPFGKGLAAGGGGFFTTFLNTISCFSNIMSYIRLFAVGLATLAIAQSFNAMAAPMLGGATTIVGILILIVGHGLNLAMGLLSVIVHGVRLNLLEFSGQLNMEWSGIEYEPFSEVVKE